MNLEDAFRIVDQVLAQFQGTRRDHQLLLEAVEAIRKAVAEKEGEGE